MSSALGLDQEEAQLAALQHQQGRHSGKTGQSFENRRRACTAHLIVPLLLADGAHNEEPGLRILHGVTLGAARTELDQVVVRLPARNG